MSDHPGLRALLDRIIDYAGLFPPAGLPLAEALQTYARFTFDSRNWMLARFVLPTQRMAEASTLRRLFPEGEVLSVSALGRGGAEWSGFFTGLEEDLAAIDAFRREHGPHARVDVLETRLPGKELDYQIRSDAMIARAGEIARTAGLTLYCEVPLDADWQERTGRLVRSLQAAPPHGLKVRSGGLTPEAFSSCEQLAWALTAVRQAGVPVKCTAGLHHPIRHFNTGVQARMHGFLNVFGGAILASVHDLSESRLADILADEDPADFAFDAAGLRWKDLFAPVEAITRLRSTIYLTFGSCSVSEPVEDLQSLGFLGTP